MADQINDCQAEHIYSAEIPISIELGSAGLYYGTSPQMKGLLVTGNTIREVMDRVPAAIAEMRAVAAMGPELSRLRSELEEAREIIGDILDRDDAYRFIYRETKPGDIVARARAFLKRSDKTESDNG